MQSTVGQVGQSISGLVGQEVLEQWRQRKEQAQAAEEAEQEQELNSLCWTCLRSSWDCLCQWPEVRPDGIMTRQTGHEVDGSPLEIVLDCPLHWPD